ISTSERFKSFISPIPSGKEDQCPVHSSSSLTHDLNCLFVSITSFGSILAFCSMAGPFKRIAETTTAVAEITNHNCLYQSAFWEFLLLLLEKFFLGIFYYSANAAINRATQGASGDQRER